MSEFYTSVLRYGKSILYRGYRDGKKVQEKTKFSPTLFMNTNKDSGWKSLYGGNVEPIKFDDMTEAKNWIEQYDGIEGFDIWGMEKFEYQYLIEHFPGEVDYLLSKMGIWSIDIETKIPDEGGFPDVQNANVEILLISMKRKGENLVHVFATKDYVPTGGVDLFNCEVDYKVYRDEATMLRAFVHFWASDYPDIITGWNTDTFDVPYIINRVNRVLGEDQMKKLSPWGMVRERMIEVRGKEIQVYELLGIAQLDYMQLYKKFSFTPQEEYSLGHVAHEEIGVTKLEYEGSFRDFYTNDWNRFVEYNIRDTQLVDLMDLKRQFIELCVQIAYMAKCNISDVFSPVKTWDVFIFSQLHHKKIAIPQYKSKTGGTIEGAYVKNPIAGLYAWLMSFDFASLYPSIIQQWNISPETIVPERFDIWVNDVLNGSANFTLAQEFCREKNYTLCANGTMYRKDKKGILPELMEFCLVGRKIAKKEMLKTEQLYLDTKDESLQAKISALNSKQMALKTLANSGYGAMCNVGFRYFMLRMGEAVTITGQASNMHLEREFNRFMTKVLKQERDYVIYCDTDSNYVNMQYFVDAVFPNRDIPDTVNFLRKCDPEFQKVINKSVDAVYDDCNCFNKVMASKREAIASKGLWIAKKRYVLKVHDSEGVSYDPPKLKATGLDLVKTSTPAAVRKFLKNSLPVIFEDGERSVREYVKDVKEKFMKLPPEAVAFPRGISNVEKYMEGSGYKSGTPMHCRSAINYNRMLKGLPEKYQRISSGDKIRFISLRQPNPVKDDVIACPAGASFPAELKLEKYYDYELQFEKVFMAPMKGMTDPLGWQIEDIATLEDFFV